MTINIPAKKYIAISLVLIVVSYNATFISVFLIRGYQRYISPRKSWHCAYSVMHRDISCSAYALRMIKSNGFFGSLPYIIRRLIDCQIAADILNGHKAFHDNFIIDINDFVDLLLIILLLSMVSKYLPKRNSCLVNKEGKSCKHLQP